MRLFLLIFLSGPVLLYGQSFLASQLRYPRVREARDVCDTTWQQRFRAHRLTYPPHEIYLRAFKLEEILEVWVKEGDHWIRLASYPFCASSGTLGPKHKQGDGQIPEGLYFIDRFNPASRFHLSLGINYPNASDRIRGHATRPGGDIFIHGACVTIGCIPITDAYIQELYWLAVQAKSSGQEKIPVHIFPFRFGLPWSDYAPIGVHGLWRELEAVYRVFEDDNRLPRYTISDGGTYIIH